jgi:PEGA domain
MPRTPAPSAAALIAAAVIAAAAPSRALADEPIVADEAPWVTIEAERGAVTVESDASRAFVYLDGRRRGTITEGATLSITLEDGAYEIGVQVKGYERYRRTVVIEDGAAATHRETLVALELSELPHRKDAVRRPDDG